MITRTVKWEKQPATHQKARRLAWHSRRRETHHQAVFSISNNRIVPFFMNLINLNRIKSLERLYSYSIIRLFGDDFIVHYRSRVNPLPILAERPRITSEVRRIHKARMRSHPHK